MNATTKFVLVNMCLIINISRNMLKKNKNIIVHPCQVMGTGPCNPIYGDGDPEA